MFIPEMQKVFHVSHVESHATSAGIPDINVCGDGIHEWIELKAIMAIADPIKIRPTQYSWFRDRVAKGGHPLMVVWVDSIQKCMFVPGECVQTINTKKSIVLGSNIKILSWIDAVKVMATTGCDGRIVVV